MENITPILKEINLMTKSYEKLLKTMYPHTLFEFIHIDELNDKIKDLVKDKTITKEQSNKFFRIANKIADSKKTQNLSDWRNDGYEKGRAEIAILCHYMFDIQSFLPKNEFLYRSVNNKDLFDSFDWTRTKPYSAEEYHSNLARLSELDV